MCWLKEECLRPLATATALNALTCLRISRCPSPHWLSPNVTLTILPGAPWFAWLRLLVLEHCALGLHRLKMLRGLSLPHLEGLALRKCDLNDGDVEDLLTAVMPRLRRLHLSGNRITARGVAELLTAPWVGQLLELHLGTGCIGDEGVALLAAAPLRFLKVLDVGGIEGGSDRAVAALATAEWLTGLTYLDIGTTEYPVRGVGRVGVDAGAWGALAAAPLTALKQLSLYSVELRLDAAVAFFGGAAWLTGVEAIHLSMEEDEPWGDQLGVKASKSAMRTLLPDVFGRLESAGRFVDLIQRPSHAWAAA